MTDATRHHDDTSHRMVEQARTIKALAGRVREHYDAAERIATAHSLREARVIAMQILAKR